MRFGAVNYAAKVVVNGTEVGQHTGAWTPFEFDVSDQLQAGTNTVEVTVSYPPMYGTETERGYLEIPHGKQSWYGTTAGIWQSVDLETRSSAHLSDLVVTPNPKDGTIAITARLAVP